MANVNEIALANCEFGCKVMNCECGGKFVFHSATYGHNFNFIQQSSTGNHCTCDEPVKVGG